MQNSRENGWKPMPLALKILFVVMLLWTLGSLMNLSNLMANGLPLLGVFVTGTLAFLVVLALDIIGPLGFLFALWTRKSWGPKWAFFYIGAFLVNSLVAVVTVGGQLGLPQILFPTCVSGLFLCVIYWKRGYFAPA